MRTFIEIELPPEAREYIQERQDSVRSALNERACASCFRWTQITSVHLTLRFLGETTERQQELLASGLEVVAAEWPALSLRISQLGGFPAVQRPRVVWLGIKGDLDVLHRVQGQVAQLVLEVGFEAESRGYSPHLTIARTKRDCQRSDVQEAGAILEQLAAEEAHRRAGDAYSVDRLVHMRSDLRRSGPVYSPLSTHTLTG